MHTIERQIGLGHYLESDNLVKWHLLLDGFLLLYGIFTMMVKLQGYNKILVCSPVMV